MKYLLWALALACAGSASAQERIWRCGNEFINDPHIARQRGCRDTGLGKSSTKQPSAMTVPVDDDGHYRVRGTVNGQPAVFLVDTGATFVGISDDLARRANLQGGAPVQFQTANGVQASRVVEGVNVMAGSLGVPNGVKVAVGTIGLGNDVLLGQSFLSHFEITMNGKQMVIRNRTD
ncbi:MULTISPECIES: TIGR02281 family clan AA aspartic protease [unclassified Variovorax]|uniref:retropepsin-like aspartic protease family protein n=1 Tax=unclassified Variovorax TaxID=663243 RepID=UPI001BD3D7AB|nr:MULTISPECIES: retropepsin-like aspartic protease [unclassified Variovorax]